MGVASMTVGWMTVACMTVASIVSLRFPGPEFSSVLTDALAVEEREKDRTKAWLDTEVAD